MTLSLSVWFYNAPFFAAGHVRGPSSSAGLPRLCCEHVAEPSLGHVVPHHTPATQTKHAPRHRRHLGTKQVKQREQLERLREESEREESETGKM